VRLVKARQRLVPALRDAIGNGAGIEGEDIEAEEDRADPDDRHQRAAGPAQGGRAAGIIRRAREHRAGCDGLSVQACHSGLVAVLVPESRAGDHPASAGGQIGYGIETK